ncbi:MAG: hypothetical protein HY047_04445 [Acidobacteria bacterium]|nr:hypothetical protein [Acidobacteriota bacterium]
MPTILPLAGNVVADPAAGGIAAVGGGPAGFEHAVDASHAQQKTAPNVNRIGDGTGMINNSSPHAAVDAAVDAPVDDRCV